MLITFFRYSTTKESTLDIVLDSTNFMCYALEDPPNEPKIPGNTRIPPGVYKLALRKAGTLHEEYSRRFPTMHKGMLWLRGINGGEIPQFTYVYIHCGNDAGDTEGCLLVGEKANNNQLENGRVYPSEPAYKRMYPRIANAIESGEIVRVHVGDPLELLKWVS